jgi:hypothetical protein
MSEINQNPSSTSNHFDKELNDMIIRKSQLQKAIISISDDMTPTGLSMIDSLTAELRDLNKTMKVRVKNAKTG